MKRKILAGFLSVVLTAGLLPASVFAAQDSVNQSTSKEATVQENDESANNPEETSVTTGTISTEQDTASDNPDENPDLQETENKTENGIENETEIEIEITDGEDTEQKKEKKEIILPDPGTVTGFEMLSQDDYVINLDSKCSMEQLVSKMPETILVHLNYSSDTVEIPVTWVSETDYETTNEYYYIFWADWDKDMFPLVEGYGSEDFLPFVEVIVNSEVMMAGTLSAGVENIVARARQMVDISWTPVKNLNGFSDPTDQLTVYFAGTTYTGIPYGQQVYSGSWVPNSTTFDTFLSAVKNPSSPMYTSRGNNGNMDSTYYANDCSSFVSYCYGLPRMTTWSFGYSSQFTRVSGNSIYNAEVGDAFNCAGAHIEIITAMNYDESGNLVSVEVSEQTPPKARTIIYTPAQVQKLINTGYTLIRYNGRNSVGTPQSYSGYDTDKENPVKVTYSKEEHANITITDKTGDGSQYSVRVTGLEKYSRTTYEIAIWSNTGGQDDLKWITLSRQTDASFTANIKISDFKHKGTFIVHLYKKGELDTVFLKSTDFFCDPGVDPAETADVEIEGIEVEDLNNASGTCRILIYGVSCPDGVSKVVVPVWSDSKQADLIWYTAKQLDETSWYVDMSISRHQYNFGTYQIHVYGSNKKGKENFCDRSTVTFTKPEPSITATVNGTEITITAENLFLPAGIKSVVVPTWSIQGGQDDLRWENASYDAAAAKASITIDAENYRHFGEFVSHVYANDKNGKLNFIGSTKYEVQEPEYSYNDISCKFDESTGAFTVSVSHPKAENGSVDSVVIPIWSGKNQDDLKWYEASKTGASKWSISGNIKNHNGNGTYKCHVYGRVDGKLVFLGSVDFTAEATMADFSVTDTSDGLAYPIVVDDLTSPVAFQKVQAAVWSDKNGQDDLVWYTLSGSKGSDLKAGATDDFTGSIEIKNHKTLGTYHVHLYGITTSGKYNFIRKLSIDVNSGATCDITVSDPAENDGKLDLVIQVDNSSWTYTKMTVPIWCSSDQSDLHWYQAVQQADGSYLVEVDKSYHKGHTGTYQIHTYLDYSNGIFGFIGKTSAQVS